MTIKAYTQYVDLTKLLSEDQDSGWIDLARVGTYQHPIWGEIRFTNAKLMEFADNFSKNVRGIELDIDYDHKKDPSKGGEAAGWLKQVQFDGTVLKGFVEWTKTAAQKIREGAYKYFSPEFRDEWVDNQGTQHMNVLFGGGITNRPYLKDLLPINLSELSFNDSDKTNDKENEVDPKALRKSIGLAEDATDEEVATRLGLIKQLSEAFPSGAPKTDPPEDKKPTPPTPPAPTHRLSEEIRELAENNPTVAGLVSLVEGLTTANAHNAKMLIEQEVTMKLSEFDNSKLVLSPVAKNMTREIMLDESMTTTLSSKIWELMKLMRSSTSFVVEMGERAGGRALYNPTGDTAEKQFQALTTKIMTENTGMSFADATEEASRQNPSLYDAYRNDSFAFRE
jgi:hypothetical protein